MPSEATIYARQKAERDRALRKSQKGSQSEESTMLIFLGKNELGQSDKAEQNHSGEVTLRARLSDVSDLSDESDR